MKRIRTLLAAWIAAMAVLFALTGAASASDYISGAHARYYSNGAGHFDGTFYPYNGGGSIDFYEPPNAYTGQGAADAGLTLAIYGDDGQGNTTATTYGVYGDHQFTNVVQPFLQPGGDGVTTPYVLQSEYVAGSYDSNGVCQGNPCLKVTELASYISSADDFYFTYHVDNEGTQPVKFRLTASADHTLNYSSDGGTGYFESGTPRAVGTVNDRAGDSIAYQEVSGSAWTRWQEGVPSAISLRVQSPLNGNNPSTGLSNSPDPTTPTTADQPDKAIAVQWDDFVTTGLAPGSGHDFQVFLRFHDWNSLVLSDPGYVQAGPSAPVTVSATVVDQYGNAVALQPNDVRYRITYGPDAPVDQSFQTATPSGPTGHADINWNYGGDGTTDASTDDLEVWIDLNHDGVRQANEPDEQQYADWFDPFRLQSYYGSSVIGSARQVLVYSYNTSHTLVGRTYKWKVTGANPQSNGSDPDGMFTCLNCTYGTPIEYTGDNAGVDHVIVWEDLNGDSDYTDWGEQRTIDLTWSSGISLYPDSTRHTQGSGNYSVEADLYDTNYDAVNGVPLYYTVTGANPQGTSSCAGSATLVTANGHTACKTDLTSSSSSYYGYGGAVGITMLTANPGEDVLTVWRNDDSASAPGQTAVLSTGTYATTLSPDQRLTTNLASSYDETTRVVGTPYDITTTLKNPDGSTDTRSVPIRYGIYGVDATASGYPLSVLNGSAGSGHATITLQNAGGAEGYDDVYMYADLNNNGQEDSYEPYESVSVNWYKRVHLTGSYSPVYSPSSAYVSATLLHADSTPYTGSYEWWIDSGTHTTQTSSNGYGYISIPTQPVGTHQIHVQFTDTDGTQSNTYAITWATSQTLSLTSDIPLVNYSRNASTGATAHVTMTLKNNDNSVVAGQVMRYEIYGANDDSGKRAVTTNSNGQATISWTGVTAGGDTVHVWPDYDGNGQANGTELDVDQYLSVTFHDRVELTPGYSDAKYEDNTENVTVKFRDDFYQPLANKPLTYAITGANPIAAPVVTTDGNGVATISWTGNEPGNDQLVVWQDSNGNGELDAGEQASKPMSMNWYSRLDASVSGSTTHATNSAFTINATLRGAAGAYQSGATLRWDATGASPQSGSTGTTDGSGHTSFNINSSAGGTDQITVWLDSNNNSQRDSGEPQDKVSVTWTSVINLSCSCSQSKTEGNTQAVSASLSSGSYQLYYQVYGANPVALTHLGTGSPTPQTITLTGTEHGGDSLFVFADVDGSGTFTSGDIANWFFMNWTPRVTLTGGDGYRVAGGQVSIAVTALTAAGVADTTPRTINYTVTGANPKAGSVQTNSLGRATINWTGDNVGSDTLTVNDGTFTNSKSLYWSAPPVTLKLTHNSANSAYQKNNHTVTATVTGVTIPSGGVPIHFSVTGANTASQQVQSDNVGVAQFTWTGTNDGTDTITAYADLAGTSARDNYDPSDTTTMTWQPLVQLSSTTTDQGVGEPHTETVHFVDVSGNPLANADVWYQISGANPTGGIQNAREYASTSGSRIQARTDGSGNVGITWVGANTGTDTLDAWGDSNLNNTYEPGTDAHATKVVTWRAATSGTSPPTGGTTTTSTTPTATSSAVVPGSPQDLDGLPTPPPPVVAKSVNVAPVKGRVFVKLPGKNQFIELLDAEQIPVGSIVDVRKGTVALTSAQNLNGGVATAEFYAGQFQIAQKKAAKPVTDLVLYGGSFASCGKAARAGSAQGSQKKKIRELWGNGKGSFRTKGKYAAAAIRGTKWDVVDYCDGTLVKVAQGVVTVEPNKGKSQALKAPKSLFVPTAGLAKKKK